MAKAKNTAPPVKRPSTVKPLNLAPHQKKAARVTMTPPTSPRHPPMPPNGR